MKNKDFRFAVAKIFGIVAAAFVFGCAPPPPAAPKQVDRAAAMSAAQSFSSGSTASNSDWRCPDSANVTLKDNIGRNGYDFTGSDSYTVCVSRSSQTVFKIQGTTTARAICVYPMRSGQSNSSYTASVALSDTPQCFSISGAAIVVSFRSTADINYMSIVDANFSSAMNSCLSSTSPCPAHSEGFVQ